MITDHHLTEIVKRVVKEDQKNNLFKARNMDRWEKWNSEQPEVLVGDWKTRIKLNQYDDNGKRVGIWCQKPATFGVDFVDTKPFFVGLFSNLKYEKLGGGHNVIKNGGDVIFNYDDNPQFIFADSSYFRELTDDDELDYKQIQGLTQYYLEKYFNINTNNFNEYWLYFRS